MATILEMSNSNLSRQKRKLMRSMGSFSVVEENIIAPTPRKISNLAASPKQRREKRKNSEEKLFGEAGFELQSILLQSIEALGQIQMPICCPCVPEDDNSYKSARFVADALPPPRTSVNPLSSPPPERAMNPIALNSPFVYSNGKESTPKLDASQQLAQLQKRKLLTPGITSKMFKAAPPPSHVSNGKELTSRSRSYSWPSLPLKISKKPHLVKA